MNDWRFFYPNGEKIEGKDSGRKFVQFYSQIYYYLNRDIALEKEIEQILKSPDMLEEKDMVSILRWKTGGTEENGAIRVPRTQYAIPVDEVLIIANELKKCCVNGCAADEFKKCFDEFIPVEGMGPVYDLTVLYFASNGKHPIFDRFAYYAITAIYEKRELKDFVKDINFDKTFCIYQNKYCDRIKEVFTDCGYREDSIFADRDIDRALWAYGHLFNHTKTNDIYKKGLAKLDL